MVCSRNLFPSGMKQLELSGSLADSVLQNTAMCFMEDILFFLNFVVNSVVCFG